MYTLYRLHYGLTAEVKILLSSVRGVYFVYIWYTCCIRIACCYPPPTPPSRLLSTAEDDGDELRRCALGPLEANVVNVVTKL